MNKSYIIQTVDWPIRYLDFDGNLVKNIDDALRCASYDTAKLFKAEYETSYCGDKVKLMIKEIETDFEL